MSRHLPAFAVLRRFVELAMLPSLLLSAVAREDSPVSVGVAPVHYPPGIARPNRHAFVPRVEFVEPAPDKDCSPYSSYPRYRLVAKDTQGTTWVSLNSPTEEIPPPPDRITGPVDCYCSNADGIAGPRFGETQDDLWRFCPTWLDDARAGLPFIPDLFCGAGPCFQRDYPGVLQQWDDAWVVDKGDGQLRIRDEVVYMLQQHAEIDVAVLAALDLRRAAVTVPPPSTGFSLGELRGQWSKFVGVTMERRGRALERLARNNYWKTIREQHGDLWYNIRWAGYYDFVPVGVWVSDTPARVGKIKRLLEIGVPVYYRWREGFGANEELGALSPKFALPKTLPGPGSRSA